MDRSDLSFLEVIFSKPLVAITENILIVNQSKTKKLVSDQTNIRVINDTDYGLSRSRNLAIRESKGELLWLMDDDCIIRQDAISIIIEAFNNISSDLITFQTEVLESGKLYWEYPDNNQTFTQVNENQTLSPEIVFKRNPIKNKVRYDERFGLGAQFEDGENYLFLHQLGQKNISRYFLNKVIVAHPKHNSSMEASSSRIIYARGAIAQYFKKNISFLSYKYAFFLLRKGLILDPRKPWIVKRTFEQGAADFQDRDRLKTS